MLVYTNISKEKNGVELSLQLRVEESKVGRGESTKERIESGGEHGGYRGLT
jgi:hypothetical protein